MAGRLVSWDVVHRGALALWCAAVLRLAGCGPGGGGGCGVRRHSLVKALTVLMAGR